MGRRSCPSCGAVMGIGSRACEACGFDPGATSPALPARASAVLAPPPARASGADAQPGGDLPGPDPDRPAGNVTLGGFSRRSPAASPEETEADGDPPESTSGGRARRAAVGVVVAVAALVAGAAIVGRGEDAGSRESLREAARAATSVTTAPSTTEPDTQRDRSLTSFADIRLGAPLSPVPTGGTVLYGLSEAGQVVRIDLDEGVIQARLLRDPNGERPSAGYQVVARDRAAILVNDGDVLVVPDGNAARTDWRPGWGKVFAADQPGEVWHVTGDLSGDRLATLEKVDGTPVGVMLSLPPGAVAVGSDRAGGMQFDNGGQRFDVKRVTSGSEPLTDTPVLASNDAVLVSVDCPEPGNCRWTSVDPATGAEIGEGTAPLGLVAPGPPAVLSPDNRYLARISGQDAATSLTLLDLHAGTSRVLTADLQADVAPVWTGVGNQLLFLDDRGELYRFDAATGDDEIVCGTCFRPLVALDAVSPAPLEPVVVPATTMPAAADITAILPTTPLSLAP